MTKIKGWMFALLLGLGMSGCSVASDTEVKETITINAYDANGEKIDVTVPYDPQRVVVLDMAALDILGHLGLQDRIVGSSVTSLDYLKDYVSNNEIANLGTIKSVDLEAVMESEPDLIFMGGRMSESYNALNEIAPVVRLISDSEDGLVTSVENNANLIASIFGKEAAIADTMAGYQKRIDALADFAKDKSAVLGMTTTGSFNLLGNDGRCSLIVNEIGFDNIALSSVTTREEKEKADTSASNSSTASHGNEASFELLVSLDPQYIFVMDRDAAIGSDGAQLAKDIMENELTMKSTAYQDDHIVYLAHPGVWYTAEGGISALDIMLQDLETALSI